jgi:hypothetical protein
MKMPENRPVGLCAVFAAALTSPAALTVQRLTTTVVAVAALMMAGSVQAETTASIAIEPEGVVIQGGEAALVFVVVQCTLDPGDELLEGNLSLSQASASGMSGLNPTCDGQPHRALVLVQSSGESFAAGEAFASAFLLFLDPDTGTTVQAQASSAITLRGRPPA